MTKLVSVIVLNHNGQHYLARCLPSIFAQDYPHVEVIVVDNGSSIEDGSVAWVKEHYPQVTLIENGDNLGFCLANNIGLQKSTGEYLILLNNDTELEPGFLSVMVEAANSGATIGMVASQILFDHDPTRLDSAGIEVDRASMAWNRHLGLPVSQEPTEPHDVFGPSAAAGLYKREMLDQIGLLDEDYFIYYEDVDLAWRGQRAGWRCLYAPQARVRHIHSGTTGQWPSRKSYLMGRNKIRTMIKNYPTNALWKNLPLIVIFEIAAIFYGLLVARDTAPLRGRLTALTEIGTYLAKRKQLGQTISGHPVQLAAVKKPNIAWKMHRGIPTH
ncbi:glycosyltransferase family 2 protein [Anaerolineales bacterium HSG25]|nr:glycosyltransferase family 2 protein [Anaerolineales bacterium HSG25]